MYKIIAASDCEHQEFLQECLKAILKCFFLMLNCSVIHFNHYTIAMGRWDPKVWMELGMYVTTCIDWRDLPDDDCL